MKLDTTDPACIEALAKAASLTPDPRLIAQALREVIDAEREACAKVAEDLQVDRQAYVMGGIGRVMVQLPRELAAAIRARGGK